jgi:hypothetical protein
MAAAADRQRQAVLASDAYRKDHVLIVGASDDQRRVPVDRAVPDSPGIVVTAVGTGEHRAADERA